MKKLIAVLLLLLMTSSLLGETRPYIKDSQLPGWAPAEQAFREALLMVFNASIELYNIKQLPYTLKAVRLDDGWVYVTVERWTILQEIKIGRFEGLRSVSLKNGYLVASYTTTQSGFSFDWGSGAIGVLVGILVTGAIVRAVR